MFPGIFSARRTLKNLKFNTSKFNAISFLYFSFNVFYITKSIELSISVSIRRLYLPMPNCLEKSSEKFRKVESVKTVSKRGKALVPFKLRRMIFESNARNTIQIEFH